MTPHKTFMKTYIFPQNISYEIISIEKLIFEFQGVGWDLSMIRISYKLTKRRTKTIRKAIYKKNEKLKNWKQLISYTLRLFAINCLHRVIPFIQSSNRSLWDFSAYHDYIKNLKKTANSIKKETKVSKPQKNELFNRNIPIFNKLFNHDRIPLSLTIRLQEINKYEQTFENHEIFEKTRSINIIKFNSFQRKSINTLRYAPMGRECCLSLPSHQ